MLAEKQACKNYQQGANQFLSDAGRSFQEIHGIKPAREQDNKLLIQARKWYNINGGELNYRHFLRRREGRSDVRKMLREHETL